MTVQDMAVRHYKGMKIVPLAYSKDDVTFTMTLPETRTKEVCIPKGFKVSLTGPFCVERHEGSVKYREELILNVYGVAEVVPSNWRNDMSKDRFEGPIEFGDGYLTLCDAKRGLEDRIREKRKRQ